MKSETEEHKLLKELLRHKLNEWFGVAITEYPSTGHELDVFSISVNGLELMVEVIWTSSNTNFWRDISIVYTSDAQIKLVIVNPIILSKKHLVREFQKIRVAETKRGFRIPDLIDGRLILDNEKYRDVELKKIVINLVEESENSLKDEVAELKKIVLSDKELGPIINGCIEISRKIGRYEDTKWLESELYGYNEYYEHGVPKQIDKSSLPGKADHRMIKGKIKIHFYLQGLDKYEYRETDYPILLTQPVSELERLANSPGVDSFILWFPPPANFLNNPAGTMTFNGSPTDKMPVFCSKDSFARCLEQLRLKVHKFLSSFE